MSIPVSVNNGKATVRADMERPATVKEDHPSNKVKDVESPASAVAKAHANLHAVKESSGDVRRVTAIKAVLGRRLEILVGMDDAIVEGIYAGATGWIAGLVNAFPEESVALFDYASRGDKARAAALYEWFLPLLRLDTVPKFVQHIKWIQAEVGRGAPFTRPPRLPLAGVDLELTQAVLAKARQNPPKS